MPKDCELDGSRYYNVALAEEKELMGSYGGKVRASGSGAEEAEINRLVKHLPWLEIKALLKCSVTGLVQSVPPGRKG